MTSTPLTLLLVDEDTDDCCFFKDALEELPISTKLTTEKDGMQLMRQFSAKETLLPDPLFLDLNMPRKRGIRIFIRNKK